eukprot:CAMPEP_0176499266 /NCGR_PEP_ID=MMETSP0200_2-20121128/12829_1 /TAXON_ID=947934 /ORGANISM="Chaetoceros sp., Strain GSL56" /LENGTH=370 /DNA_ID=CAMNT_0017897661 /DNA_START=91 /DNA_END=1203 /DNA_ORIENTATION=-
MSLSRQHHDHGGSRRQSSHKDRDNDDKFFNDKKDAKRSSKEKYRNEIDNEHSSKRSSSSRRHDKKERSHHHHHHGSRRSKPSHDDDDSHRHHDDDDDDRRRRRHHHRSKSPSSRKRSRHHDKDRHRHHDRHYEKDKSHDREGKKQDKRVKIDPNTLVSIGPIKGNPPKTILDPEQDYFAYHNHLRLYLYRHKGQYFEDLSSQDARKAFVKFCSKYNQGKLEEGFYDEKELPEEATEQCKRTLHKWKFTTTVMEQKSLDVIKAGVKKQTLYSVKQSSSNNNDESFSNVPLHQSTMRKVAIPPRDDTVHLFMLPSNASSTITGTTDGGLSERKKEDHDQLQQREAILKSLGLGNLMTGKKIEIAPRQNHDVV